MTLSLSRALAQWLFNRFVKTELPKYKPVESQKLQTIQANLTRTNSTMELANRFPELTVPINGKKKHATNTFLSSLNNEKAMGLIANSAVRLEQFKAILGRKSNEIFCEIAF